jgi:CRISPR-associated protein Csm3
MRLIEIKEVKGTIELLSGLHIGMGKDDMEIGGVDSPVIRNQLRNNTPYIPGSSLKGKMLHLLQLQCGISNSKGIDLAAIMQSNDEQLRRLAQLFGYSAGDELLTSMSEVQKLELANTIGPSRLIFFDCPLSQESVIAMRQIGLSQFTELKKETAIDRLTGTAKGGSLRTIERVPAGAKFDFQINIKIMEGDIQPDQSHPLFHHLQQGLNLLQLDSIGGSGSRGYGKIKIHLHESQ